VSLALLLEAVVRARATGDSTGAPQWAAAKASPAARGAARAWLAYCALGRPWVRRACALAAGAASFLIVWSEATIGSGTHPDLSPFSHVRALLTLTQPPCPVASTGIPVRTFPLVRLARAHRRVCTLAAVAFSGIAAKCGAAMRRAAARGVLQTDCCPDSCEVRGAVAQAIHAGARGEVATQLLVGAPLAYMAAACYFTLARLGVFYFYRVVPGATGSHSLLMNAAQARPPGAPCERRWAGVSVTRAALGCAALACGADACVI